MGDGLGRAQAVFLEADTMSTIQNVRGTRDFYPEDMSTRQWLYNNIRQVSEAYGYQEYDGPFLEKLELYAAKSGEELVKEQSYVFPDRSGELIALRPELTPSLARMVAQLGRGALLPLRWWSYGPFWRYERTQKGRSREFFQWNLDLIGVDTPEADAEVVAVACALFRNTGLTSDRIRIKVNNRRLAEQLLNERGISGEAQSIAYHLIDRIDKLSPQEWDAYAQSKGFSEDQVSSLRGLLTMDTAWEQSAELVAFFSAAEALEIREYLEFDPSVIRGLDYYTGTVYEARDPEGNFRSILGGGRYDDLVSAVGGNPIPATGFAMGDVVFGLVLETFGLTPKLRSNPADLFVPTFDETCLSDAIQLASELRSSGYRVEWYPEAAKLGRQFKYSDRQGIPIAVILGPEEIQTDTVAVKDMRSGNQEIVQRSQLITYLESILSTSIDDQRG
jgi:histidyl-tRNA synthetase